jgi:hypothetical protein
MAPIDGEGIEKMSCDCRSTPVKSTVTHCRENIVRKGRTLGSSLSDLPPNGKSMITERPP